MTCVLYCIPYINRIQTNNKNEKSHTHNDTRVCTTWHCVARSAYTFACSHIVLFCFCFYLTCMCRYTLSQRPHTCFDRSRSFPVTVYAKSIAPFLRFRSVPRDNDSPGWVSGGWSSERRGYTPTAASCRLLACAHCLGLLFPVCSRSLHFQKLPQKLKKLSKTLQRTASYLHFVSL